MSCSLVSDVHLCCSEMLPRRSNWVSVLLLCGVAAGGYWLRYFGELYRQAWAVDRVLANAASKSYKLGRLSGPDRTTVEREIATEARAGIVHAGVTDELLAVEFSIDETSHTAIASAQYRVAVKHPLGQNVRYFSRTQRQPVDTAEWQ